VKKEFLESNWNLLDVEEVIEHIDLKDKEDSVGYINQWVEEITKDRIKKVILPGNFKHFFIP